jgi:cobalt/nickel transport system permease protein
MTLAFEPPPCNESLLRRRDPRWKLAALVLAAAAVGVLGFLPAAAVAFLGSLVLIALARVSPRWYMGRIAALALVLVVFVALLPFVLPGEGPVYAIGPLHISLYGLRVALLLLLKALTIVTLMLVVLVSAPLDATLKAAHALRVPGLLIQIMVLAYRYLFLLADEFGRLRVALRVRGYRLRSNPQRLRIIGHLTGTVLVRGYERAERVGQAMRCRGFDGTFRSLADFRTQFADVAFFFVIAGCAAALVCWDLLERFS